MSEFYRNNLKKHGDRPEGNGWDNNAWQNTVERYDTILGMIPEKNIFDSVCELGYGNGFGLRHVEKHFNLKNYIGYDNFIDYVLFCKKEYPMFKTKFKHGTIENLSEKVDWIFSVGVYTYKGSVSDAEYYLVFKEQMKIMHEKSEKGFLINGFTNMVTYKDTKLYYHNILNLIEIVITELGGKFSIICKTNKNVPYEFFLMVLK